MNTISKKCLNKKVFFISSYLKGQCWIGARERARRIVASLMSRENVFEKSTPSSWWYLLASSWAFNFFINPLVLSLVLKTDFDPTTFISEVRGTRSQVLFCSKDWRSSNMACVQPSYLRATQTILGFSCEEIDWCRKANLGLGLWMPAHPLLTIGWEE